MKVVDIREYMSSSLVHSVKGVAGLLKKDFCLGNAIKQESFGNLLRFFRISSFFPESPMKSFYLLILSKKDMLTKILFHN